jgi:RNA ligase
VTVVLELTELPNGGRRALWAPVFTAWPKIARLRRECVVTEKIDGTNAAIGVTAEGVYAQSRTRIITPKDDNFGFAAWVAQNSDLLASTLGLGLHFGEWWGAGIQRGYGLKEKRFSLFNTSVWNLANLAPAAGIGVSVVPTLYTGIFSTTNVETLVRTLAQFGSQAAPGFMKPEGVVIWHEAARISFKQTIEKDEAPKGKAE